MKQNKTTRNFIVRTGREEIGYNDYFVGARNVFKATEGARNILRYTEPKDLEIVTYPISSKEISNNPELSHLPVGEVFISISSFVLNNLLEGKTNL